MDTHDPWGYDGYARCNSAFSAPLEPDSPPPAARCQASSPSDDSGTPRAPRLAFEGRPGKACPGAPKKGRAPISLFDLSGEAPVRRLSFGSALGSQSSEEDVDSDSMQDDDMLDEEEEHEQQHWSGEQHQHQQCPPQQNQQQDQQQHQVQHTMVQQPPVQQMQQAWQQHQQQQQQQQQQHHHQQLPSPQQLFRQQLQQPQLAPLWGSHQQLLQPPQPQQPLWSPLSPTGVRPPAIGSQGQPQGSTTPCRLFR